MLRLLCFVGAGILLGGIVSATVGPPGAAAWAFPVGLIVMILSIVLLAVGRSLRGVNAASHELIERAKNEGRVGLARVDALIQTGTQLNEQPLCDIELTVRPVHGGVYRTSVRRIVQLTEIPRFQPGSLHVVALLVDGKPDVAITNDDASAEIWADTEFPPVAAAGELRKPEGGSLRADGTSRKPLIGTERRTRPLRIIVFVLAGLLAATAVVLPYRDGLAETAAAIPEGRLHADLRDPDSLDRALDALAEKIGHDRVVSVTVAEDLVSVNAPVSVDSLNVDRWYYRRGAVTHDGPGAPQPEVLGEQFALSDVDWAAVRRSLDEARATVGVDSLDGVMYNATRTLHIDENDPWNHERTGPVDVSFGIDDGYRTATFRVAADGTGLERTDP